MDTPEGGTDPADLAAALTELARKSQLVAQQFLVNQAKGEGFQIPDPGVVGDAFLKLSQAMLADPGRLMQAPMQLWQQMGELWQHQLRNVAGIDVVAHLREVPEGTKGSLRSERFDVGEIARLFGGGGHKLAAGYTRLGMRPEEAKEELLGVFEGRVNLGVGR